MDPLVRSDGVEYAYVVCNLAKAHYLLEGHNACIRPLHRLGYRTSGTMISCKAPFLQPLLDAMLGNRQIYREYKVLARGYIA